MRNWILLSTRDIRAAKSHARQYPPAGIRAQDREFPLVRCVLTCVSEDRGAFLIDTISF